MDEMKYKCSVRCTGTEDNPCMGWINRNKNERRTERTERERLLIMRPGEREVIAGQTVERCTSQLSGAFGWSFIGRGEDFYNIEDALVALGGELL